MKKIDSFFKTMSIEDFDNMFKRNGINNYKYNKRLSFKSSIKRFIIAGISIFTISLIGFIAFIVKSLQIIHPTLYIFGMIVGLGWFLTGISIIKRI